MSKIRTPLATKLREVAASMDVDAGRHKSVVDPGKKFLAMPDVKPPRRKPFSGYDREKRNEYMAAYRLENGNGPKPAKKKKIKLAPRPSTQETKHAR